MKVTLQTKAKASLMQFSNSSGTMLMSQRLDGSVEISPEGMKILEKNRINLVNILSIKHKED